VLFILYFGFWQLKPLKSKTRQNHMPLFMSGGPLVAEKPKADKQPAKPQSPKGEYSDFEMAAHVIGVLAARISMFEPALEKGIKSNMWREERICEVLNALVSLCPHIKGENGQLYLRWINEHYGDILETPWLMRTHWKGPCYPDDSIPRSWLEHFGIDPTIFSGYSYLFVDSSQ
jgi:hypothetical protein